MTLSDLKKLAQAATPGPRYIDRNNRAMIRCEVGAPIAHVYLTTHDAAYIAAISPERILAMLACIEAADAMRDKGVNLAQTIVDPGCDGPTDPVGDFIELFDGPTQRAFDAALAKLGADHAP